MGVSGRVGVRWEETRKMVAFRTPHPASPDQVGGRPPSPAGRDNPRPVCEHARRKAIPLPQAPYYM